MIYQPEFFQLNEFRCPCCGKVQVAAALVLVLDVLRRAWADTILVNSGFRCPIHNKEVGGALRSRHLLGCAADIRPRDLTFISPFHTLIGNLFGRLPGWELKFYARFVHVAVPREETAFLWNGGKILLNVK